MSVRRRTTPNSPFPSDNARKTFPTYASYSSRGNTSLRPIGSQNSKRISLISFCICRALDFLSSNGVGSECRQRVERVNLPRWRNDSNDRPPSSEISPLINVSGSRPRRSSAIRPLAFPSDRSLRPAVPANSSRALRPRGSRQLPRHRSQNLSIRPRIAARTSDASARVRPRSRS